MKTKNLLKKAFLLLALIGGATSAWADTAIISPANMSSQPKGTLESTVAGNVWYGNGTGLANEFIIQITGNKGKAFANQGTVTISSTSVASFKNSNGAQNTITLPSGSYASSVTFYVTANDEADARLSEINGNSCSDAVTSHKDGSHPTIITKTLGGVNSFTFTFSSKQVLFAAVVTYDQPVITTQPVSATYQKNEVASALTVAAIASKGDLIYQWYSCDDANKTNASDIGGATNASYTPATTSNGTFYYFCRVKDDKGSTDSNVATITVAEASAPTISVEATATSVFPNTSVTLTATIGGIPEPTVQWYSCDDALKTNPVSIGGATNTTYSPSTSTPGTYYFYAVATNSQGSATSDVITLTVNPLYTITYSLGEVTGTEGIVPASVDVESSLTIPSNWLLYKEGYTLTAWNDGSADHAIGSNMTVTANTTLTPVFTLNGENAHLGYNATTVTWDFQTKNGAPTWQLEGNTGVQITQTTVGGSSIDVKLDIDATSGKLNNASNNDWAQTNSGTKLIVPVLDGAVVKVYVYQEGSSPVTFGGNAGTYDSNIYSYTATSDGDLEIVIGDQRYTRYVSVTYPSETAVLIASANNTIVPFTKVNITDKDYLTVSTDNWATGKTYGDYTGDFYNMSTTSRVLTIKVTGASTFEAFVRNDHGSDTRTFKVKVGDAEAVDVSAAPSTLKSTGVFAIADPTVTTTITLTGGTSSSASVYPVYAVFNPAVSKTISAAGWATYCSPYALDLEHATGLTDAYIVTGATGNVLNTTSVKGGTIPANTGILIEAPEGTVTIPVVASSSTDVSDNELEGVTAATEIAAEAGYVLMADPSLGFYKNTNAFTVGANTAYLPASIAAGGARSAFFIGGNITGVENVEAAAEAKALPVKRIVNGKLVIENEGVIFNAFGQKVK